MEEKKFIDIKKIFLIKIKDNIKNEEINEIIQTTRI